MKIYMAIAFWNKYFYQISVWTYEEPEGMGPQAQIG